MNHQFDLSTCEHQLEEIRRASRYPRLRKFIQPHEVGVLINTMRRAHIVANIPRRHVASDPDDAFLLDLVEAGGAAYLVTGDKRAGLPIRKRVASTRILTAPDFVASVLR